MVAVSHGGTTAAGPQVMVAMSHGGTTAAEP